MVEENKTVELNDEELKNVSGGIGDSSQLNRGDVFIENNQSATQPQNVIVITTKVSKPTLNTIVKYRSFLYIPSTDAAVSMGSTEHIIRFPELLNEYTYSQELTGKIKL